MSPLTMLSSQPWVERLGWTLLSFLWQGTLIAALYTAARFLARSSSPNIRYSIACLTLAVLVVAPMATWSLSGGNRSAVTPADSAVLLSPARTVAAAPVFPDAVGVRYAPSPLLPAIVACWIAGSAAVWLRLLGGWMLALRLRSALVTPAPPEWQHALACLCHRVRVARPVGLMVSAIVRVPTVVGWLRPVILMPVGALAGIPAEQVEALLLHELAHIRRADYLVNLLQSAAEALLFYHPAVWWVSGHIRAEREACCDDAAVAVTGDALGYAQTLACLEAERIRLMNTAMAASGGSLSARIGRLLGYRQPAHRRVSPLEAVAAATLIAVTAAAVFAQPAALPKFEVASIKPAVEQGFMMIRPTGGGRLTASAPLMMLMQASYSLQSYQIVGAPSWMESERWAIEARGEGNPGQSQLMLMLQSLLEERFALKTHRENRDLAGYTLVVARSGAKLPISKEGGCQTLPPAGAPGQRTLPICGFVRTMMGQSGIKMEGSEIRMPELAKALAMSLGRPVTDKTGLTGAFDVQMEFAPDASLAGLPRPPGPAVPESTAPTIFSAIQEQLGLRLESGKGPVEVFVIDHVERPSVN